MPNDAPGKLHNAQLLGLSSLICRPTLDLGGKDHDVLVLVESVTAAVMLTLQQQFDWNNQAREAYLRTLTAGVRKRMEEHDRKHQKEAHQ